MWPMASLYGRLLACKLATHTHLPCSILQHRKIIQEPTETVATHSSHSDHAWRGAAQPCMHTRDGRLWSSSPLPFVVSLRPKETICTPRRIGKCHRVWWRWWDEDVKIVAAMQNRPNVLYILQQRSPIHQLGLAIRIRTIEFPYASSSSSASSYSSTSQFAQSVYALI